jgi:hypothetical protein
MRDQHSAVALSGESSLRKTAGKRGVLAVLREHAEWSERRRAASDPYEHDRLRGPLARVVGAAEIELYAITSPLIKG